MTAYWLLISKQVLKGCADLLAKECQFPSISICLVKVEQSSLAQTDAISRCAACPSLLLSHREVSIFSSTHPHHISPTSAPHSRSYLQLTLLLAHRNYRSRLRRTAKIRVQGSTLVLVQHRAESCSIVQLRRAKHCHPETY